jgi:rSAM/selenodomain-associated transferase 1
MSDSIILAQLAREPVAGKVKTRLMPTLSAQQALTLHCAMVEHMARVACQSNVGELHLWVAGDVEHELFRRCEHLGAERVLSQGEGDLGERMGAICEHSLAEADCVILLGSDVPAINGEYLAAAARALEDVDAVVGPALDGGYVLLGLRSYAPQLFTGVAWGGETVLSETIERLDNLHWSYRLLDPLADIDRPEDLQHLPDSLRLKLQGARSA